MCVDQFFLWVLQSGDILTLLSLLQWLDGMLLQRRTFSHQLLVTLKFEKKTGTPVIIALPLLIGCYCVSQIQHHTLGTSLHGPLLSMHIHDRFYGDAEACQSLSLRCC